MLDTRQSLAEFFREHVERVARKRHVPLAEATRFYLVNLLAGALPSACAGEPLALAYGKALSAAGAGERFRLLKKIGDRSLYVSGFFGDSLNRKAVDIGYYIAMGERAYGFVSRSGPFPELFSELSGKFTRLVDLLAEISESSGLTSDRDLLRLYERWLKTGSVRLMKKLCEQGILPVRPEGEPLH